MCARLRCEKGVSGRSAAVDAEEERREHTDVLVLGLWLCKNG